MIMLLNAACFVYLSVSCNKDFFGLKYSNQLKPSNMLSSQYSTNFRERFKSALIALAIIVVSAIYYALKALVVKSSTFPTEWTDWKTILLVGVSAGLAYLGVTFFQDDEGAFSLFRKRKLL
jgi:hypothetical protein